MSLSKAAQLGRLAARIKWAQAPAPAAPAPAAAVPAAPAVPAPVAPAPAVPAPAVPAPAPAPAVNPTFTRADIPKPPLGQRSITDGQQGRYYNNAALTHAYKRQQNIDVDAATGVVNNPYQLNAEQMRGLSHYIFPEAGEQYRLNELQRTGQANPYANRFEYDAAMREFLAKASTNQNRLLESARKLYPGMKPGGGNIGFGSIPPNTMSRLRNIGWQSLQPPTTSP